MANTRAAKKAHRSSLNKKRFNTFRKTQVKNALKSLRSALNTAEKNYGEALKKVYSALDKAAKTKAIPKAKADRRKSRVAKMVAKSVE
ncbi:MAG: hypothetical protein OHK0017_02780 [Patescibacteria group bacterium]